MTGWVYRSIGPDQVTDAWSELNVTGYAEIVVLRGNAFGKTSAVLVRMPPA
jgi:hypothetical protein